jgi:hypothetical protein
MDKLVFTLAEVAEMTGWNEESIRRACHEGRYRHTRRGKFYGMTMTQVEAMVASHEVEPIPGPASARERAATELEIARQANVARLTRRGAA